jgi:hypothetical protein
MRTIFASILGAAAVLLTGLPASAAVFPVSPSGPVRTAHPAGWIDDEHGVLTTPCVVFKGEVLHMFGYVTGAVTVTSVKPDGPVDRVTLSPAPHPPQSSEVLDFTPRQG